MESRRPQLTIALTQLPFRLGPVVGLGRRHHTSQILACHAGGRSGTRNSSLDVGRRRNQPRRKRDDAAVLGTGTSKHPGQASGVDVGDRHRTLALQVGVERHARAEIGHAQRQVLDDQTGGIDFGGFDVLGVDAVAADVRISQRDDLPAVARIGENFLVTGERGVEHKLANGDPVGADGTALKDRAICKGEDSGGQDWQQEEGSGIRASPASLKPQCRGQESPVGKLLRSFAEAAVVAGKPSDYSLRVCPWVWRLNPRTPGFGPAQALERGRRFSPELRCQLWQSAHLHWT